MKLKIEKLKILYNNLLIINYNPLFKCITLYNLSLLTIINLSLHILLSQSPGH